MRKETTGYFYAFGAAIALASSFIFSKDALMQIHIIQFGFLWFACGVVWNLIYTIARGKLKDFRTWDKKTTWVNTIIALLEAVATALFYIAINKMTNPAIVSFIGSIGPVFVTIMSLTILKERFSIVELSGIILTIAGIFIISYTGQNKLTEIFIPGTEYVVAASFLFAVGAIIARKNNQQMDAILLSLQRSVILFVGFAVLFFANDYSIEVSKSALISILTGSVLETLITIIFAYVAYKYIKAAKISVIISTKSIFALIAAYLFWGILPSNLKMIGGAIALIGVVLVTIGKQKKSRS